MVASASRGFAGIANGGRRCNAFFGKLVKRGHAHEIRCVHNRARVYHVHHKPLYFLIGEASSRYRRPVSPRVAVERLMLLDAVLAVGDVEWLTTAAEKAAYLEGLTAKATADRPQQSTSDGARPRPSPVSSVLPIGLIADGRTLLPYLANEPTTETFRTFLQTHVELLSVAPNWTIRIVFPRPLDHAYDAYQTVIHEELESPLHSATIGELQSYFELRLEAARGEPMHRLNQGFLRKGHEVFAATRFTAMYHRWLKHGNAVFAGPSSPAIAEALNSGRGRVESVVLPHSYRHLAPLVADTPARPELVEKGLRRGPRGGPLRSHGVNPRPQPPADERAQHPRGVRARLASSERVLQGAEGAASYVGAARRATAPWGGVLCRPWTAVLSAQVRNRDVKTPAPAPECDPEGGPRVVHVSVPRVGVRLSMWGGSMSDRAPSRGQKPQVRLCRFVRTNEPQPCRECRGSDACFGGCPRLR